MSRPDQSDRVAESPSGAFCGSRQTEEHGRLWKAIADKVEQDPELLQIPLENINRWSSSGLSGTPKLAKWEAMICAARDEPVKMSVLLAFLRSDSDESLHMKGFDPFPGVLSTDELDEIQCISAH